MPVTILNKVADLREREELNLVVEESLDSSAIIWNVRILPAADIDNIEIRAYALGQTFTTSFARADGDRRETVQYFIRRAQRCV